MVVADLKRFRSFFCETFLLYTYSENQRISPTLAMSSTSHRTFFGRVFTATQERAGLETKYFA